MQKNCFILILFLMFAVGCGLQNNQDNPLIEQPQSDTVYMPIFSPSAETYSSDQSVTILCSTEGATIYYATNGVTPDASSNLYTTPIAIEGDGTVITIEAIALKNGLITSEVATATYSINYLDVDWEQATSNGGFSVRQRHTSVVYDSKLWVIGGWHGGFRNDVWYSTDGANWTQATASAAFSARTNHSSVVFDNKMWVIGGNDGSRKNDVWYSSDGITWTQATAEAAFPVRCGHSSVVFDNKTWVIGGAQTASGWQASNYLNDAWYSTDGINWTEATASADFGARGWFGCTTYDGGSGEAIWVSGGRDATLPVHLNDVWYSTDGTTWTQATGEASFSARTSHTSVSYDSKIWVICGADLSAGGAFTEKSDVWYSADGISWYPATLSASYPTRFQHTSVIFDSKPWLIGGLINSADKNDVWSFTAE